jgi:hypothetical protein
VVALSVSGLFRWMAGFADRAVDGMDRALRLAADLEHPPSIAFALHHANILDLWRADLSALTDRSTELLNLSETYGYPVWRALALVFRGTATLEAGDVPEGAAEIDEGFELYNQLETPPIFWPVVLMMRATAYAATGRFDRAVELLREAEGRIRDHDPLRDDLAIAQGQLLLALPTPDLEGAEARFARAASIAHSRRARMVELNALTQLAAVQSGDRRQETLHRLRDLYSWFTEGLDTPPLTTARTLLEGET